MSNPYEIFSARLFNKASARGVPLSGAFELTARCNLNCKMCYIHRQANDRLAQAEERSAGQWLALAEECRDAGTLLLLLTGGEPFLRPDFRDIYTGCRRLGMLVSVNTNASLITEDDVRFLAADPPARMNITLYGAGPETYGALCGDPGAYQRTVDAILALKAAGVLVKLNYSVTPENAPDAPGVYAFAKENGLPIQAATYMFPPARACEKGCFSSERLTPWQSAREQIRYDRSRFPAGELRRRWERQSAGVRVPDPDAECQELPTERIRCRAGSSTFWVTYDGQLRPCGMMTAPTVGLDGQGFADAWRAVHAARQGIMVPAACTACPERHACDQCAAICQAETGEFTGVPDYLCQRTRAYLEQIRHELESL